MNTTVSKTFFFSIDTAEHICFGLPIILPKQPVANRLGCADLSLIYFAVERPTICFYFKSIFIRIILYRSYKVDFDWTSRFFTVSFHTIDRTVSELKTNSRFPVGVKTTRPNIT